MNHHVRVVEQDPPAEIQSLGLHVPLSGGLEPYVQLVVDRPDLWPAIGRHDHEVVRHLDLLGHVVDTDVLPFLEIGQVGRCGGELSSFDDEPLR